MKTELLRIVKSKIKVKKTGSTYAIKSPTKNEYVHVIGPNGPNHKRVADACGRVAVLFAREFMSSTPYQQFKMRIKRIK